MKSILKKLKFLVVMIFTGIIMTTNVLNVSAAAQTISLGSGTKLPAYLADLSFKTKLLSSGEYVYCLEYHKATSQNVTATLVGELDAGFAYLMEHGYPKASITGDSSKDYYITQTAVWWYLDDTTGSSNLTRAFKETASDPNNIRKYVKELVAGAKQAKANGYAKTSISLSTSNSEMKLSSNSKYFESESFTVSSTNISTYKVSVSNAPTGTIVTDAKGNSKTTFNKSESFKIKIPASSVKDTNLNMTVTVSATGTVNKAYEYKPTNSRMQNCYPSVLTPETQNVSATAKLTLSTSKITIIKLDRATDKSLAGATLVLKDSNGNEITRWKSTTNAHVIRNLKNGSYTVEEIEAPTGYKKLKEPISFKVTDSNRNITVKVYNDAKSNVVTITKIDGSTGKALAGAVLVVKNAKGEEVARFETTEDPKVFTDLADGTYTIEEVQAPSGYKKSNDVITITIDEEHATHQVTFYNYPEVPVPDTAATSSIIMTIIGILLIGSTVGFVYKNAKK